jgi:hypothetical protein
LAKVFKLPLCSIDASLQAHFLPAVGVDDGDVVFSFTIDAESGFAQCSRHIGAVPHHAGFHLRLDVGVDGVSCLFLLLLGRVPPPSGQTRLDYVGLAWGEQPRPLRIVGTGPTFPEIRQIAERIEILLPAGREGVEAFPGGKLDARDDEM